MTTSVTLYFHPLPELLFAASPHRDINLGPIWLHHASVWVASPEVGIGISIVVGAMSARSQTPSSTLLHPC